MIRVKQLNIIEPNSKPRASGDDPAMNELIESFKA